MHGFVWVFVSVYMLCTWECALFIFCLYDLSIGVSGVLKSPTIIVLLSVSPFMSVNICFMYLSAALLGTCISTVVKSFSWEIGRASCRERVSSPV